MCPVCLTTTAMAAAGTTSAGGLATLLVAWLRARAAREEIPGTRRRQALGASNTGQFQKTKEK